MHRSYPRSRCPACKKTFRAEIENRRLKRDKLGVFVCPIASSPSSDLHWSNSAVQHVNFPSELIDRQFERSLPPLAAFPSQCRPRESGGGRLVLRMARSRSRQVNWPGWRVASPIGEAEPRKNFSPETSTAPQHRKEPQMISAEIERCAGIHVGKEQLDVHVVVGPLAGEPRCEYRQFGTVNAELQRLPKAHAPRQ